MTIVDDFFRAVWVIILQNKSQTANDLAVYPYSPQENGVVKRKRRHLLQIARALLFRLNYHKNFGGKLF